MKKIAGIVVVVVVLAAIAAPYAIGYRTEQLFRYNVQELSRKLNQRLPDPVSIQVTSYDRGYLSSTATTQVTIDDKSFEIDHDIAHGPYQVLGWARVRSHIDIPADIHEKIKKLFEGPALVARTTIGFFGDITVNLHSSALRQPFTGYGLRVAWQGMDAIFRRSGDSMHLSLKIPRLAFKKDDGQFELTRLQLSAARPGPPWEGHGQLSLDHFTMTLPDGSRLGTQAKLQTRQTRVKDGSQVNSKATLTLEDYRFESKNKFLPNGASDTDPFHLIKQKIIFAIKGLDARKLAQLSTALRQQLEDAPKRGLSKSELNRQFSRIIVEYGPKVLTPDSVVVLTLPVLKTEAGKANGKLTVQLTGSQPFKLNPITLLNRLQIDLVAVADVKLVKHGMSRFMPEPLVRMRLHKLRERHFITKHGDRYKLSFHYENGQFTLNGKKAEGLASALMRYAG